MPFYGYGILSPALDFAVPDLKKTFPQKDPQSVLDYRFDWKEWLGTDTISSYTVTSSSADFVIDQSSNSPTAVTVWLKGGVVGQIYEITCRIVTAANRTDDRTARFPINNR